MSSKDNIRKLIKEKKRRLQKRKEQEARYGLNAPPEILLEIEDLETEIRQLQTELKTAPEVDDTTETTSAPTAQTPASPPERPVFNLSGTFNVGNMSMGGEHHIENQTIDMSEKHTTVESRGTLVEGDQIVMSGNFQGAMLNIKSQLDNVTQSIGALPAGSQEDKATLARLLNGLQEALTQTPPEKLADAKKVSKRTEALVNELEKEEPNEDMVDMIGNGLKQAAQNLAEAMPVVLTIATQIVAHALKFTG